MMEKYFGKRKWKWKLKEDNNNNSEMFKGDIESEGECKDSKRRNNGNDDNPVAEEKDNSLEVSNYDA